MDSLENTKPPHFCWHYFLLLALMSKKFQICIIWLFQHYYITAERAPDCTVAAHTNWECISCTTCICLPMETAEVTKNVAKVTSTEEPFGMEIVDRFDATVTLYTLFSESRVQKKGELG